MNKVELVGRLTRDPEVRYSGADNANVVARFSIAVNRRFKNAEGNYGADFISCVAFGKTAEFIDKYFRKGMALGAVGRIQTGSYTNKDGIKVYTTDVVVEEVEFVESKSASDSNDMSNKYSEPPADGFMKVPDAIDEELPFN